MDCNKLGVVAIGRNEGARLRLCMQSVLSATCATVYVDSGSTDGSCELASTMGADVVSLDMSQPFTAARARNFGLRHLLQRHPDIAFVQFVDGDCEILPGWLEAGRAYLVGHPQHAVVCGRRRERHPERSIYNGMCDREWNTPAGEALACGGDAMMRIAAFEAVHGYRDSMVAGEEPELCFRLRHAGWKIFRLDHDMTLHDANISRFGQWWMRAVRAGHAFAEGAWLHGTSRERFWVRETFRALYWGAALPVLIALATLTLGPVGLTLAFTYLIQWLRLVRRQGAIRDGTFLILAKFAEAYGAAKFCVARMSGTTPRIIEYK